VESSKEDAAEVLQFMDL